MMNSESQYREEESESQCPQCKKKYTQSSSQEQSVSEQRIVIPLRKQLIQNSNPHLEQIVRKLQGEVENLKRSNLEKDRIIDDLKRDMEHKMTHYMILGEINKQAEELSRLKTELTHRSREAEPKSHNFKEVSKEEIRNIVKEESKKNRQDRILDYNKKMLDRYHSATHKKNLSQRKVEGEKGRKKIDVVGEYYGTQPVFKISDAKKQLTELEKKNKFYEEELVWMSNFIVTFIKTMQRISSRKYHEDIIISEWNLKKKAKVCWRYLKHLLTHLYSQ